MKRVLLDASAEGFHRQKGQALLLVTFSLTTMMGVLGLATDLGWAYYRREAAQSAADAAASAVIRAALATSPSGMACGTNSVWCGSPAGTATACPAVAPTTASTSFDNGCMLAAANGFTTSGTTTVTIQANASSSAPTAPGTTVSYWATVRVTETSPSFFGPVSRLGPLSSGSRSTSAITTTSGGGASACMYILSPHGTNALNVGNGASISTSSCGIYVNSDASPAMTVTGGATVTSSSIRVVGSVVRSNGGTTSSTPTTGVSAVADPLVGLPSVSPAGTCNSGNFTNWQATAYTPSAGTYCGLSVGNGMSAVLGAGTYVINGGTFSIQGGSTLTTGGGVMIYLTNGATVNIANGANVTMAPQSTGAFQGILFYQDRTMASPGTSYFAGGANMHLSGSLYFPNSLLNIDNGANAAVMAIVAGSVNFQGGANLQQATTQSQTGLVTGGAYAVSVVE